MKQHSIHDITVTNAHKDDTVELKRKLHLRMTLLINYMMEENLFVYVKWLAVEHAASLFSVRNVIIKKVIPG